jgi:hypothetical protein
MSYTERLADLAKRLGAESDLVKVADALMGRMADAERLDTRAPLLLGPSKTDWP